VVLVVQTGKSETIMRRDDIEFLEAGRNHVTVSTRNKFQWMFSGAADLLPIRRLQHRARTAACFGPQRVE
jgi:hypothetical protein